MAFSAPAVPPAPAPLDLQALRVLAAARFPGSHLSIHELPGGASLRRFFRVVSDSGQSAVGMFVPDAMRSEEASAETATSASRWPFLEIRELLASRGIAVPALYGEDCRNGWLLVEDLGDRTLADALVQFPERKTSYYQRAVADLAKAQAALSDLPSSSVIQNRCFEVSLLEWEVDHFREWALEARGYRLNETQATTFQRLARRIAEKVRCLDYGFVHRDYQSRNLMVTDDDRLVWIDFQDALLGPRVYDLVALLNDSYQTFSRDFVEERLREYAESSGQASAFSRIAREFDLVTVQRKLKDAGRFVFIEHKKGDASYLCFVEPTIRLVQASLERLREDADLREMDTLLRQLLGEDSGAKIS